MEKRGGETRKVQPWLNCGAVLAFADIGLRGLYRGKLFLFSFFATPPFGSGCASFEVGQPSLEGRGGENTVEIKGRRIIRVTSGILDTPTDLVCQKSVLASFEDRNAQFRALYALRKCLQAGKFTLGALGRRHRTGAVHVRELKARYLSSTEQINPHPLLSEVRSESDNF